MSLPKADHPAVHSAKRSIRHNLSKLKEADLFSVAAYCDLLVTGKDTAQWLASANYARDLGPAYVWKCDAQTS